MKKIISIAGAVILLASATGAGFYLDDRYAKADLVAKTNTRLDVHIIQDRIDFLNQEMWRIEDRCKTQNISEMPVDSKERYRHLKQERNSLEKKLEKAMEK